MAARRRPLAQLTGPGRRPVRANWADGGCHTTTVGHGAHRNHETHPHRS
ncbi:hypothetical protein ACH4GK_40015 [Streptomyces rimosus]|nr:hypothetical protein [Streptomyces rimosus]